ncbi:MAG TPA: thioredoxin domain-containing protein [Pyrinomonadaceae bacterium]|nr:thioredoxin domain-containing protein [Pyrinomonadaceae bacterium]
MNPAKILLLSLLLFVSATPASAVVLRGVVIEVRDGQSVVVFSGGRKFTVVLKGVDAPELAQDFGETSRQHLAYLVLDKPVEIEFSQLDGGHVIGKVICNQLDMGLQVVRDGAAWYDTASAKSLSEAERNVYAAAQQLAREESRGLWQDGTPMPPWEWRRAQASKNSFQPVYKSGTSRGLSTEDLAFARRSTSSNSNSAVNNAPSIPKPSAKPFNTPGQDADFRSYLNQGRVSIVYFYANWCPACRKITPLMEDLNQKVPDMQVLFMDIGDWGTPVAQQHGVSFVPYLKIYDKNGSLVADGKSARAWLAEAMAARK